MFAIAANALYTTLYRRGTTRQLARAIVICVISALLLLPAIIWYDMRFTVKQAVLPTLEIDVLLAYVAMCGWVMPLGMTTSYCLLSSPRNSATAVRIPRQKRDVETVELHPPRYQPGVEAPYVFGEDTPWGWLEYRSGNFQGQRLELKRMVITIGRDEQSDIWLDDEMASRHHAELAWDSSRVCLTDCGSLNGVLLNGRRIRGTVLVKTNDLLEVGSHRFTFILAERKESNTDQYDPLVNHKWRSTTDLLTETNDPPESSILPDALPGSAPGSMLGSVVATARYGSQLPTMPGGMAGQKLEETAELDHATPSPSVQPALSGTLLFRDGEMAGKGFLLDRPVITLGRDPDCELQLNDASISRRHVQFLRQADGDYVQDLGSRNGTKVNDDPLRSPRLLHPGDIIRVGNIGVEYTSVQAARTAPLPPPVTTPPTPGLLSGPTPLKLPSRQKE